MCGFALGIQFEMDKVRSQPLADSLTASYSGRCAIDRRATITTAEFEAEYKVRLAQPNRWCNPV